MAKCSNLTFVTSTAPSCIDWEGRDQDEVPTGRRVATATVGSGVPKHFSSDNGVSHSDGPIWTESNATCREGLGPRLSNCCKHGTLCSARCEPVKLHLSMGSSKQLKNWANILESDNPHGKPAEDSRGLSSALALADPYRSSLRSMSHQGHNNIVNDNDLNRNISVLSCHACDYIPLYGVVDVKPTFTNEIHADFPEPIVFMGMKIIGDSGAGETMLPYPKLFVNMTVPRHNLTVVLADGTPVPVDGIGVTMFSPTTWFVRALSVGILSMSSFDDNECSTHFHDGRMEIYDSEWKILLTGTRCNDNLYYLDQAHIERALSIAQRMYTLPQSIPEIESYTSGTDTIEDEDTETSEFISEDDDDESHHTEEDEDAEAERWYRDLGLTRDEADELFI